MLREEVSVPINQLFKVFRFNFFKVGVCHPDLLLFGHRPPEDVGPDRARVSPQMFPVLHRRLPQALHASHGQTLRQPSRSMHQVS